ncbi:TfoX/Sxy family protein [Dyadobacter bucti]|uniref:TfoX/Sxy family protein n=1 Tax=Dyadobacter bucti TaxID=2572203 RepID=UPI003F72B23A
MAFDEKLANKVREALIDNPLVEERMLFQGLAFMVDDKLCICVRDSNLLCRIGPEEFEQVLEMTGVTPMIHNKRVMNGYVFVSEQGYNTKNAFDFWIKKCLDFNKIAKPSKSKSKRTD